MCREPRPPQQVVGCRVFGRQSEVYSCVTCYQRVCLGACSVCSKTRASLPRVLMCHLQETCSSMGGGQWLWDVLGPRQKRYSRSTPQPHTVPLPWPRSQSHSISGHKSHVDEVLHSFRTNHCGQPPCCCVHTKLVLLQADHRIACCCPSCCVEMYYMQPIQKRASTASPLSAQTLEAPRHSHASNLDRRAPNLCLRTATRHPRQPTGYTHVTQFAAISTSTPTPN